MGWDINSIFGKIGKGKVRCLNKIELTQIIIIMLIMKVICDDEFINNDEEEKRELVNDNQSLN